MITPYIQSRRVPALFFCSLAKPLLRSHIMETARRLGVPVRLVSVSVESKDVEKMSLDRLD